MTTMISSRVKSGERRSFPNGKHVRKACALTRTLVLSGPCFSVVVSKTVGRRVLGECIAFSGFGRRPSDGRFSSRNREKIQRGRAAEEKEGTWKEISILFVYY